MTTGRDDQKEGNRKVGSESVAIRFGENLLRVRRREGLSQEQLAARASLHRTEIGLLEKGDRVPRIDTAIRLAGALAAPLEELVSGIHWTIGGPIYGSFTITPRGMELRRQDEAAATGSPAAIGMRRAR